jgi:phospholipid/cholesterol/gamma-HCH transport system substrate-binding protein
MRNKQRKSLIVGIFVTLGLAIFIVTIYLVGKKENLFGSPVTIAAIFEDVQGLREGDNVRMSGIDIGTVRSLSFIEDNRVYTEMSLEADQVMYVKKDSRVTIGSEGLMGSKVVMIIPGKVTAPPVAEFDTLATVEQVDIDDILFEVNKSSENIAIVSNELISITRKINRGDGIFGKIFTDTTLTQNLDDATRNISYLTENLYSLSEQVSSGQGIVGKLFADTSLTSEIGAAGANFDEITNNLREITGKINKGEGIFGRMFTDTALTKNLYMSSKNLQETSGSLMLLAERLNNDSSALNLLIDDPAFADSLKILIHRLNTGMLEATDAADAIQRSGLIRLFSKKEKEEKVEKKDDVKEDDRGAVPEDDRGNDQEVVPEEDNQEVVPEKE